MGSSETFGEAYAKALLGAGVALPTGGTAFISINDQDKRPVTAQLAHELITLGFRLVATRGTRDFLQANGVPADLVLKVHEGRPNIVDLMINDEISLVINTPMGRSAYYDDTYIRRIALQRNLACITTLSAVAACVEGVRELASGGSAAISLQEQQGSA